MQYLAPLDALPLWLPEIVRIVDLVKNYYMGTQTVHVLKDMNLSFDEGDFVALMGPSGSGKSTLLNVLGCLDKPTSGSYYLGGAGWGNARAFSKAPSRTSG